MAMERLFTVRDTHTRSITALGYFPPRREILIGFEGRFSLNRLNPDVQESSPCCVGLSSLAGSQIPIGVQSHMLGLGFPPGS